MKYGCCLVRIKEGICAIVLAVSFGFFVAVGDWRDFLAGVAAVVLPMAQPHISVENR
jgi:hypothetical protein